MKLTKSHLKQIIREELQQTLEAHDSWQTQVGASNVYHTTDPELDQLQDITLDVTEQGGDLGDVETALKDQGFDASLAQGALVVDTKYIIAIQSQKMLNLRPTRKQEKPVLM